MSALATEERETCSILDTPKPNGGHFRKTLEQMTKVRPRYPIDTWTNWDAAAFWVPDYDFTKANSLHPTLILGVVARLVMRILWEHPGFSPLFRSLVHRPPVVQWNRDEQHSYPCQRFSRALYGAYGRPNKDFHSGSQHRDGTARLATSAGSYCHRTTCEHQESFTGGCVAESTVEILERFNQLVRWDSLSLGGLYAWLPPLRHSEQTPYLSVKRARSHKKEPVITRDMAVAIGHFNVLMPPNLLDLQAWEPLRFDLASHIENLEGERLRYWGMVASKPTGDALLRHWNTAFAASAWMFGKVDSVYRNEDYMYWGLEWEPYSAISENQLNNLFPTMPEVPAPTT